MAYPASSDVTSGQATLAAQYNNLRADALRFSQAVADAANLGDVMSRFSSWVRLEYLATNKIRVPYSSTRPPALVVNGYLLKATVNIDSAAASGSAGARYVFANRTAASTTFTITISTSSSEGTDQRLIGSFYWDGSNIDQGSIRSEEIERPVYWLIGTDAEKSTSPAAGEGYIATDTGRVWVCFVAGTWVLVAGAEPSARAYNSAAQSLSDSTVTAITLDSERFDNDSIHSTSTNTSRLTATTAGKYLISANIRFASNATGERVVMIRLNGVTIIARHSQTAQNGQTTNMAISCLYSLSASDYVEMVGSQTSGGALNSEASANLAPEFSMVRVSS